MTAHTHCAHVTAYWQARIAAHAAEIRAYRREFEREQEQIERDSL